MRTSGRIMVLAAVGMGLALTACDGTSNGASASGSASAGATTGSSTSSGSTAGSAASCLVGNWKSTALDGKLTANGMNGTLSGGNGVQMDVASDGKTTVTFDGMQPINFTFVVAGGNVKGTFLYGGKVNGTVKTPSDASGTWEPTGNVDFSSLNVTVDIASPMTARVADKLPLAQFVGSSSTDATNAVDAQPILKKGTYKCSGNTLVLSPPTGTTGNGWTLQKA